MCSPSPSPSNGRLPPSVAPPRRPMPFLRRASSLTAPPSTCCSPRLCPPPLLTPPPFFLPPLLRSVHESRACGVRVSGPATRARLEGCTLWGNGRAGLWAAPDPPGVAVVAVDCRCVVERGGEREMRGAAGRAPPPLRPPSAPPHPPSFMLPQSGPHASCPRRHLHAHLENMRYTKLWSKLPLPSALYFLRSPSGSTTGEAAGWRSAGPRRACGWSAAKCGGIVRQA